MKKKLIKNLEGQETPKTSKRTYQKNPRLLCSAPHENMRKFYKEKYNIIFMNNNINKYKKIIKQLEILYKIGFRNNVNLSVEIKSNVFGDIAKKEYKCKATYQVNKRKIEIKFGFSFCFIHEYFHHLFHYNLENDKIEELEKRIKKTKSYKLFEELDKKDNDFYYTELTEIMARFGEQYIGYILKNNLSKNIDKELTFNKGRFYKSDFLVILPLFLNIFKVKKNKDFT